MFYISSFLSINGRRSYGLIELFVDQHNSHKPPSADENSGSFSAFNSRQGDVREHLSSFLKKREWTDSTPAFYYIFSLVLFLVAAPALPAATTTATARAVGPGFRHVYRKRPTL